MQAVESGPFPKQGCVVCCQLEGASRGYLLAVLSSARPGLPPRLLAGDRNLWHFLRQLWWVGIRERW